MSGKKTPILATEENFMFRHLLKERDQEARLDELLTDSEGWDKGLAAFEIYMDECFEFPFEARFRNKEYGKKSVCFVVLRLTCCRRKNERNSCVRNCSS